MNEKYVPITEVYHNKKGRILFSIKEGADKHLYLFESMVQSMCGFLKIKFVKDSFGKNFSEIFDLQKRRGGSRWEGIANVSSGDQRKEGILSEKCIPISGTKYVEMRRLFSTKGKNRFNIYVYGRS